MKTKSQFAEEMLQELSAQKELARKNGISKIFFGNKHPIFYLKDYENESWTAYQILSFKGRKEEPENLKELTEFLYLAEFAAEALDGVEIIFS